MVSVNIRKYLPTNSQMTDELFSRPAKLYENMKNVSVDSRVIDFVWCVLKNLYGTFKTFVSFFKIVQIMVVGGINLIFIVHRTMLMHNNFQQIMQFTSLQLFCSIYKFINENVELLTSCSNPKQDFQRLSIMMIYYISFENNSSRLQWAFVQLLLKLESITKSINFHFSIDEESFKIILKSALQIMHR
ncbi:CLUMA_CG011690, isoform A [Clunio marinus]|uniref:CLUMA_CG011690, isoform A n=1 Tax=Clunio marinus TaxID=568069 RepID=A0A1J1IDN7_9DIPT|nr:CLUMA_CG011690, isoform A [Clunio marinus]